MTRYDYTEKEAQMHLRFPFQPMTAEERDEIYNDILEDEQK